METFAISLICLAFSAYVAFHVLVITRLAARKADGLLIAYAVLRMLTFPLLAVGALLSLLFPSTQAGAIGFGVLMAGVVTSVGRLVIGRMWLSRQKRRSGTNDSGPS